MNQLQIRTRSHWVRFDFSTIREVGRKVSAQLISNPPSSLVFALHCCFFSLCKKKNSCSVRLNLTNSLISFVRLQNSGFFLLLVVEVLSIWISWKGMRGFGWCSGAICGLCSAWESHGPSFFFFFWWFKTLGFWLSMVLNKLKMRFGFALYGLWVGEFRVVWK